MDPVPKIIANLLMNDMRGLLNKRKLAIAQCPVPPEGLAEIAYKISRGILDKREAKQILIDKFEEYDLHSREDDNL